jgi:excisionase family DNA binding protein
MEKNENLIHLSEKFNLTITEAVRYFGIGENTLRKMIKENGCDYVLYVGNKTLIKRKKFEKYLEKIKYI